MIATNPTVIIAAQVDRNRWDLDTAENKIAFLTSDPTINQMEAVRSGRIVIMFCDRIIILDRGTVRACGRPKAVLTQGILHDVFRVNAEISVSSDENYPQYPL